MHLSLSQNGQNVFMASDASSTYGISTRGKEFMAGVLHHLSSIWAFIAPHPNRLVFLIVIHDRLITLRVLFLFVYF